MNEAEIDAMLTDIGAALSSDQVLKLERLRAERERYRRALHTIAYGFLDFDALRGQCESNDLDSPHFGMDYEEALGMAYDNMQGIAKGALES